MFFKIKAGGLMVAFFIGSFTIATVTAQQPPLAGTMPQQGNSAIQEDSANKVEILTSISFNGNTKFTDKQLMDVIGMKIGDNLTKEMIGEAIQNIVDLYRNNGADLSISPNVTPGAEVATIEFMIDESGTKGDAGPYQGDNRGGGGGPAPGGSPPDGGAQLQDKGN